MTKFLVEIEEFNSVNGEFSVHLIVLSDPPLGFQLIEFDALETLKIRCFSLFLSLRNVSSDMNEVFFSFTQ